MTSVLLLGDAVNVREDAAEALKLFTPELTAAINNIGIHWEGHVDHWFTLHPDPATDWEGMELARKRRVIHEGRNDPICWAHKMGKGIDRATEDWQGSSGLFAVKGLLEIGCDTIVLAGIPLLKGYAHFYSPSEEWKQAERYHRGWNNHLDEIAPFVRSMSGWTKDLLGAPTPEWLEAQNATAIEYSH